MPVKVCFAGSGQVACTSFACCIFENALKLVVVQVHLIEIDIETDGDIAEAAGVNGTPTIQLFKDKERVENLPGVKMKSEYRQKIEALL